MAIKGRIEDRVEIKTSAQEFHDVFNGKPHHLANITPDKVHGCTLHDGDLGSTGAIIEWHYTHEGQKKSTKQIIEVDDGKYKVVYKIIEGHFSEEYNNFHIIYDAIPKEDGGAIVHWIFEFEKPDENTPDPTSLLEYLCGITKDIDAHIQEEKAVAVGKAIKGRIEDKVEIKTSAQEFHDVINGKPHHLANITPEKVHGCTLHAGDLGSTGSIIEWHYTHEGQKKSTKQIIEVDDGKYKVVYKIIGGHFSDEYNNFHIIYDAIPKPDDGGTIVHWIFEYEKPDENTPDPTSVLEYLCGITKDIDAHIQMEKAAAVAS